VKALLVPKFERAIHLTPTNMSEHTRRVEGKKTKKTMYLSCDKRRPMRVMVDFGKYWLRCVANDRNN
jgi:hypothetical protein